MTRCRRRSYPLSCNGIRTTLCSARGIPTQSSCVTASPRCASRRIKSSSKGPTRPWARAHSCTYVSSTNLPLPLPSMLSGRSRVPMLATKLLRYLCCVKTSTASSAGPVRGCSLYRGRGRASIPQWILRTGSNTGHGAYALCATRAGSTVSISSARSAIRPLPPTR